MNSIPTKKSITSVQVANRFLMKIGLTLRMSQSYTILFSFIFAERLNPKRDIVVSIFEM